MLKLSEQPDGMRDLLGFALYDLEAADRNTADPTGGAAATPVKASDALPVHLVGLGAAEDYPRTGWRTIITRGEEIGVADLDEAGEDKLAFAGLAWGPGAERLAAAAALAEAVARNDDYEVKIVESPALKLAAIWLSGADTRFIPYLGVSRMAALSADEFKSLVAERFARHLARS